MRHIYIAGDTAEEFTESMLAAHAEVKAAGIDPESFTEPDDNTWVFGDDITVHWGYITGEISEESTQECIERVMNALL